MSNKTAKAIREERARIFKDDPESDKQLPHIADEIRARVRNIKRQMFEIGQLLTEAKTFLEHGKFKKWIKDNFDISYPTANNFMNVHLYCLEYPQLVQSIKSCCQRLSPNNLKSCCSRRNSCGYPPTAVKTGRNGMWIYPKMNPSPLWPLPSGWIKMHLYWSV